MSVTLNVTQLRQLISLPERPYEDPYQYDGTPYYDVSHRELCTLLQVKGTVASAAHTFVLGQDFQITAGMIDWTIAPLASGTTPDFGSAFYIDYTYSTLAGDTASTAVQNACMIVQQDLGSFYPYGSMTPQGISYNQLATMGAAFVAAREACYALSTKDIEISQKSRRGSIVFDDTKKTSDWLTIGQGWDAKYKQYLTLIRPAGQIRSFGLISPNSDNLVFGMLGRKVFDDLFPDQGYAYSGIF